MNNGVRSIGPVAIVGGFHVEALRNFRQVLSGKFPTLYVSLRIAPNVGWGDHRAFEFDAVCTKPDGQVVYRPCPMTSAEIFLVVATISGPLPLAMFIRTAFGIRRMFFFHGRMGLRVIQQAPPENGAADPKTGQNLQRRVKSIRAIIRSGQLLASLAIGHQYIVV